MTTKAKTTEAEKAVVVAQPVQAPRRTDCVVNSPNCVGRAVNGKVCSYHAMHYRADGTRRP